MIWVFDGDPSTNVVCEGYAKAFKYLCDHTVFDSSIECILAGGDLVRGSRSEPHMWNVLKMDDGNNYLVDVTNCDSGNAGYPDKLFLAERRRRGRTAMVIQDITSPAPDWHIIMTLIHRAYSVKQIWNCSFTTMVSMNGKVN